MGLFLLYKEVYKRRSKRKSYKPKVEKFNITEAILSNTELYLIYKLNKISYSIFGKKVFYEYENNKTEMRYEIDYSDDRIILIIKEFNRRICELTKNNEINANIIAEKIKIIALLKLLFKNREEFRKEIKKTGFAKLFIFKVLVYIYKKLRSFKNCIKSVKSILLSKIDHRIPIKNIKVSIIIPVYNGENFLQKSLDSAISQTYNNIEILIINDGSDDNTEKIINEYQKNYKDKIKYFKKNNSGISETLNLGLKEMTGEYFSWLSHDDLYDRNKIELQIDYLHRNKLLGTNTIIFGDYAFIDEDENIIGKFHIDYKKFKNNLKYVLLKQGLNGLSLLIPRQAFVDYGGFDPKLNCTQDYEKWLDFTKSYCFRFVEGTHVYSRIHPNQTGKRNPFVREEEENLFLRIIESFDRKEIRKLENSEYEFYFKMIQYLNTKNYLKSIDYCKRKLNGLKEKKIKNINILLDN